MSLLSRIAGRWHGRAATPGVSVADLEDLRPIGNVRGRMITNKAGRGVLSGRWRGRKVKLYEAHNPVHARFIATMAERLPGLLPETLGTRGAWVIAEWVEGTVVTDVGTRDHCALLRSIHEVPVRSLPPAGFCYWSDFIAPRFLRASALLGQGERAQRAIEDVEDHVSRVPFRLSHPDFTPANLVREPAGNLKCVDNELMCFGRLPALDLCNAVRPMPRDRRNQMAAEWFGDGAEDRATLHAAGKAWIAREVGAAFVSGDLARAASLLRGLEQDAIQALPFDVRQLR
jgi:hypothetical protein